MYKKLAPLNKENHKTLKISPVEDFSFTKENTHIPLLAGEIQKVAFDLPVVFTSDETPALIALVSLGAENLLVDEEGKWRTSYLPSYIAQYPFLLASQKENTEQKLVMVDEEASVISKRSGKQLFKKNGEDSDILKESVKFLTHFGQQLQMTQTIAKVIAEAGILDDQEITIGKGKEKKILVRGFKVVNREKLNALSDDILANWARKGIITLIDMHIMSLESVKKLFEYAQQAQK